MVVVLIFVFPLWLLPAMRVLVVGAGGREHALAWRIAQSPIVDKLYVCPGNGGTAGLDKTCNLNLPPSDFSALVKFSLENEV